MGLNLGEGSERHHFQLKTLIGKQRPIFEVPDAAVGTRALQVWLFEPLEKLLEPVQTSNNENPCRV